MARGCRRGAAHRRGPEFKYYGQALQAAVDGLGIAMGIRLYIDDDLAAGRLVAPFALSVPKGMRWYLSIGASAPGSAISLRSGAGLSRGGRARHAPQGPATCRMKNRTLVIGGGQAGLVMSHRLERAAFAPGVERHRIAERWRSERWDGLKFQFPNWSVRLPDFPFPHSDPDAFATTDDIIKYIEAYAGSSAPDPLRRRGDAALAA